MKKLNYCGLVIPQEVNLAIFENDFPDLSAISDKRLLRLFNITGLVSRSEARSQWRLTNQCTKNHNAVLKIPLSILTLKTLASFNLAHFYANIANLSSL